MKVTISKDMKRVITLEDLPAVKKVIAEVREDGSTAEDYAELAARVASGGNCVEVLRASAEIVRNNRIKDAYGEGSGDYDVWICFIALVDGGLGGVVMGGANLTDIWQATGDNKEEIKRYMYIRRFKEEKR